MVHPDHRSQARKRGCVYRCRKRPSTALLRVAALLDSTPLDIKSGGQHAGDVSGVGIGCDGSYLFLMAASGGAPVPGEISCAIGALAMPTATCSDGALLQHAASARLGCDLLRPTWAEQPRNWKRLLAYVVSSTALLYTHYLSGLAVAGGVCVTFLFQKRFKFAAAQVTLLAVLYSLWVPTLVSVLHRLKWFGIPYPYEGGSVISDQLVRLAYLLVSFSFGETFSIMNLLLSVMLTPIIIYALWRAVETRPAWLPILLMATAIAWVGVSRFEQFVFMPNQLLFVLPFFLMLIVRQMNLLVFVALLVLYAGADYAYFTKSGFLVKPYATPYKEMADVILDKSRGQNAIVAVNPFGVFSEPLLNRLDNSARVIILDDEASAREVLEAARRGPSGSSAILLWRRTSDVSPGCFVTKLEQDLSVGREVWHRDFVAYSLPERWARRLLRGPGQPEYYYRLSEFRTVNSDASWQTPH